MEFTQMTYVYKILKRLSSRKKSYIPHSEIFILDFHM